MTEKKSEHIEKTAEVFKLLSDPTRLKIVGVLLHAKKEMCVYEIADAVGMSHSATSHQLAKLEARDIVRCWRMGQTMCYEIADNELTSKIKEVINIL